jgi:hypothetical protein
MNLDNNKFFLTFAECLKKNMIANPELYSKSYEETLQAYKAIKFEKFTYDKDSKSIKDTCKILGIKNTYLAIDTYLKNNQ